MFVRNPRALWTEFDGQVMIMAVSSGRYFEIKGVGTEIWKLLEKPFGKADIVCHIADRYQVEFERCEKDVLAFLQTMLEADLLIEEAGNDAALPLSA